MRKTAIATPAVQQASAANAAPVNQLARPATVCARFGISRATLHHWCKTKPGFPQPARPSSRVTLYDLHKVSAFIQSLSH